MKNLDFEWLTDEFMLYCRSAQLRKNHEQAFHFSGRFGTFPRTKRVLTGHTMQKQQGFRPAVCLQAV